MAVVGHREVLSSIPNPLPHCLLLTGPEGVGKRRSAHLFALASGVQGLDFQNLGELDKAGARAMTQFHSSHPLSGPVKTTVADLTRSSPEALNSILKLLEEPPSYSRIILHSDKEPLLTIRSRCFNVRFGVLTEEEVAEVLKQIGAPEFAIPDSARASQGRVSLALSYARQYPSRKHVEGILEALVEGSAPLLDSALTAALEAAQNEPAEVTAKKREVVSALLARSLRSSLTIDNHVLAPVPIEVRVRALRILESTSRPALRVRSAVWVLVGGQ